MVLKVSRVIYIFVDNFNQIRLQTGLTIERYLIQYAQVSKVRSKFLKIIIQNGHALGQYLVR